MPKLTDMTLRKLPIPASGQVTYDDEGSPLKVRVSQGGSKTFIVMLGSGRRHTIGRYGEVTLVQARDAARKLRAEKTLGRIFPNKVSVDTARTAYLRQSTIKPTTRWYTEWHLARLSGQLQDVTPREVTHILDSLKPSVATQCLRVFSAFFNWCIRKHYLDKSPCERMRAAPSTARSRVLSDDELKSIWRACEQRGSGVNHPNESSDRCDAVRAALPANFATIVKLLILTGQRRNEIASLQTSWITSNVTNINSCASAKSDRKLKSEASSPQASQLDLSSASFSPPSSSNLWTITLPASITKNGREHTFPLSNLSSSLLAPLCRTSSGLLFPARGKSQSSFNGWSKSKAALDKLSGVQDWTLHDLRRTYATIHQRIGTPLPVIEKLLNHVSGSFAGVVGIYQRHDFMPEMTFSVGQFDEWFTRNIIQGY